MHGIPEEKIISQTENEVVFEVLIPKEAEYFDGHFPQFKLLPAVAQVDLVAHYARKYFEAAVPISEIKRFKFSDKILPDSVVLFKIKFDSEKSKIAFEITDKDRTVTYSSGNYLV